jgi:hypothetical protein
MTDVAVRGMGARLVNRLPPDEFDSIATSGLYVVDADGTVRRPPRKVTATARKGFSNV